MFRLLIISVFAFSFIETGVLSSKQYLCKEGFSCDDIVCHPVFDCPSGRIVPNPASCNCCKMCTKNEMNLRETKCRKKEKERNRLKSLDEFTDDLYVPQCDENGDYKLIQKKREKAVCVDPEGNKLFGEDKVELFYNMTCKCSLYINKMKNERKLTFMTRPQEHCRPNGNFKEIQCIDNLCYCANTETGEVESRLVRMDYIDKLRCYDKENPDISYLTPCDKELLRSRNISYNFHLKGIEVVGLEKVDCDPDGSFSPLQCDTSGCSCTNEYGLQIRSYFTDAQKTRRDMLCNCARNNEFATIHAHHPAMKCDSFGNYNLTQCFREDQCFCVDSDGDVISKILNMSKTSGNLCAKLLDKLDNLEKFTTLTSQKVTEFTTRTTEFMTISYTTEDDYDYLL